MDYRAGDVICRNCGHVIGGRMIDESDETRAYAEDSKKKETRSSGMKEDAIGANSILLFGGGENGRSSLERAQRCMIDKLERKVSIIRSSLIELCSKMNISKAIQVVICSFGFDDCDFDFPIALLRYEAFADLTTKGEDEKYSDEWTVIFDWFAFKLHSISSSYVS